MKKFYFMIFAAVVAASMAFSAQAQDPSFEAVLGLNLSTVNYGGAGYHFGPHVGLRASKMIHYVDNGQWVYLGSGALLSSKGFSYRDAAKKKFYATPWYLDIPVHVGYMYQIDETSAVFAEAGPYFGIGLFGKKEGIDLFSKEGGFRRFDCGIGLRAGFELKRRIPISVGGDFGFIHVADEFSSYNRNIFVEVGYKF